MRRTAFTLIELLVVIAVIAVLMSILLPSLNMARDQAQRIHCVSNTKNLVLAWLLYKDDWDGKLVPGHTDPGHWVARPTYEGSWDQKKEAIRDGLLYKYTETVDIYRCPADRRRESSPIPVAFRTFSIVGGANGETWGSYEKATIYSEIKKPAQKYVFVEEMDTRGANIGSWQMDPDPVNPSWTDPVAMWHNNRTTLGFADGHAEMHAWENQYFIDWNRIAMDEPLQFSFGHSVPSDAREDAEYMAKGFPYKALK
jgi:prepilin-type N-terminal cleavage/methylation domain-containing protein/prepilin-type processing-associated H-X9-DG protein